MAILALMMVFALLTPEKEIADFVPGSPCSLTGYFQCLVSTLIHGGTVEALSASFVLTTALTYLQEFLFCSSKR